VIGADADERARIAAWLLESFPTAAVEWLPSQRWFGGKARSIAAITVLDVFWLPEPAKGAALVVLDVGYTDDAGGPSLLGDRYAALIAMSEGNGPGRIAPVPWRPEQAFVEAATAPEVVHALLAGLQFETSIAGLRGGQLTYADATKRARRLIGPDPALWPTVTPLGVEQSNTSMRVGDAHILKLFRRLEVGTHPQVEIGRFLAGAGFRQVPPLEGSLVYHGRAGAESVLAVIEGWMESAGDGWTHVVGRLATAARTGQRDGTLTGDVHRLGTTTADFHAALASDDREPAFAPEPVTADDRARWQRRIQTQAQRSLALVERLHREWDDADREAGRALLARRADLVRELPAEDQERPFCRIRVHGDFHLGQTLKTPDGFAIIDFEGEPARPLAERREKACALKDVAGMLRSLDYAAAHVQRRMVPGRSPEPSAQDMRGAFLDGYRSRLQIRPSPIVPVSPDTFDAWLDAFEMEKALYELEYEINNRPDWRGIPLQALVRLGGIRA
jgi:maltose alpha-D-glucosyltransferase/alpha-amylase